MSRPQPTVLGTGPASVRLVPATLDLLRGLAEGTVRRGDDWHPEFPADDTVVGARLLLEAFAAVGAPLDDRSPWWMFLVVVDGQVVGEIGVHGPPAPEGPVEVEIGYEVVPALRGRGVATRACALLLEHAWRHGADVVRADAEPGNVASRAVLRSTGFRLGPDGGFVVERPSAPT